MFVNGKLEDMTGEALFADVTGNNYGWSFPSVAGFLEYSLWPDSNSIAYPFHLIVDLNSMTILDQDVGTKDFYQLEAIIDGVLDSFVD